MKKDKRKDKTEKKKKKPIPQRPEEEKKKKIKKENRTKAPFMQIDRGRKYLKQFLLEFPQTA